MLKVIEPGTQVFTHKLRFDVLMKDLSVRKMEVHFNGWEDWGEDMGCQPGQLTDTFTSMVSLGLQKNRNVIGWQTSRVNEKNEVNGVYLPTLLFPTILPDDECQ